MEGLGEDSVDDRGYCDIAMDEVIPAVKTLIRAVRLVGCRKEPLSRRRLAQHDSRQSWKLISVGIKSRLGIYTSEANPFRNECQNALQ